MNWISISSEEQIKDLLSSQQVFAVFKHSTRCSISSVVKNRLERDWTSEAPVYYLDLLSYRNVSDLIAKLSGVVHESPQIIVFKNGQSVYDASHTAIAAHEVIENMQ